MTVPESVRALDHFPACMVIVWQSVMSAIVTYLFEDGPPCSWGSLLCQWNHHPNCSDQMDVLPYEPFYSY